VLGYSQRPIPVSLATPEPTFTPQPSATVAPSDTPPATLTAVPKPDFNTASVQPLSQQETLRIGAILVGMMVVALLAVIGLRLGQR